MDFFVFGIDVGEILVVVVWFELDYCGVELE